MTREGASICINASSKHSSKGLLFSAVPRMWSGRFGATLSVVGAAHVQASDPDVHASRARVAQRNARRLMADARAVRARAEDVLILSAQVGPVPHLPAAAARPSADGPPAAAIPPAPSTGRGSPGAAGSRQGPSEALSVLRTMVSTAMSMLAGYEIAPDAFGVVGHSMGGALAIAAASADDRIKACCTNGGSVYLERGLMKYPRVLARMARMLDRSNEETIAFIQTLRLADVASTMRAELLCLQGGRDVLVDNNEAQSLIELHGHDRSTLQFWPEGVHCLYNHAFERNCVLTDWFATQLH